MSFTTDELARLRIPLSALPGFDPVGLRAWWPYLETHVLATGPYGSSSIGLLVDTEVCLRSAGRQYLYVDLADASTADRLARWLAGRVGLEVGCTAPGWFPKLGPDRWLLRTAHGARLFVRAIPDRVDGGDADHHWHSVPGLPSVSFGCVLPDGSLYTDRLALALVAQHIGGAR